MNVQFSEGEPVAWSPKPLPVKTKKLPSKEHVSRRTYLYHKQGGLCCYCEVHVPEDKATLEHLKRKIDGGTNDWDNLAMSCQPCNSYRGAVDWFTYKSYKMGELNYG